MAVPASSAPTCAASAPSTQKRRDQCVIPEEDPSRIIDGLDDDEDELSRMMGEGEGDDDDGGDDDVEDGGESASGYRARRPLSPAVHDAYEMHIESLKQTKGMSARPHLYGTHQTFWLPQKSNYFIIQGASKPRPTQLYNPRFFYWDPDLLVEGGLKCPNCRTALRRHGFTRARRVVDLENCFYMIGERHLCPQCKHPKTNAHSLTFNSWDPRILAMLPPALAAEFPAQLSHRSAISLDVFALMRACFNYGVGSKQFSHILLVLHHRHFSQIHVQYLDGLLSCQHGTDDPTTTYEAFSDFSDRAGYGGFVPSSSWLCMMYDAFIEDHGEQIDQKCAMGSGDICCLDHSHKVRSKTFLLLHI